MMGRREVGTGSGHSSGGGVVGVGEDSWDRLLELEDDAVDDIAVRDACDVGWVVMS